VIPTRAKYYIRIIETLLYPSHLGWLNRNYLYVRLQQDSLSLLLCTQACSRFPPPLLALGFVDLPMLSPAVTISTALRSQSLGFSNRCKNAQLILLFTLLNTSTPFETEDPS
jgi:hypothetical protein